MKRKERTGLEAEMFAMKQCAKALDGLSPNQQLRVMIHLRDEACEREADRQIFSAGAYIEPAGFTRRTVVPSDD